MSPKSSENLNLSNSNENEKKSFKTRDKFIGAGAAAALALGLAACGPGEEEVNAGPNPDESTIENPMQDPIETPEPEYTIEPTEEEPKSPEVSSGDAIDVPVVYDGPFGDEYAQLTEEHIETLETTNSFEQLKAMSLEEYAKQPVQDRLAYLIESIGEGDAYDPMFRQGDNIPFDLVVDNWSTIDARALYKAGSPEDSSKLAISDRYRTVDINTGDMLPWIAADASNWHDTYVEKSDRTMSSWASRLEFTGVENIRQREVIGLSSPLITTDISYDGYDTSSSEGDVIVDRRTIQAVELKVELFSGEVVTMFARGEG